MTYAKIVEGYTIRPGAYLKGAHLEGAALIGANLSGTNLEGAILMGASLEDVKFNHIRYDSNTKYDEGSALDLYIKSLKENK